MKILKKPEFVIYDTENPNAMKFCNRSLKFKEGMLIPLHHVTNKPDWEFLNEYFKGIKGLKHPIFISFDSSYYYCLQV